MSTPAGKLIGERVRRREDPRFLTGRTRYVDDLRLPRMVHAAFVRSPHAHAVVKSIDGAAAVQTAGVLAILTGEETTRLTAPIRCDSLLPEWQGTEFPVLGWPRVRFVGEAVAIVVATDRCAAEDGVECVAVEYDPLPVVASAERALAPGATLLHEGWRDNCFLDRRADFGDVDRAFAEADYVWRHTYRTSRHTGFPLEGRASLADFNPATRELTLYTASQIPSLLRTGLADTLRLPEQNIRVVSQDVGGGFGVKGSLCPEEVAVCLASMRLGRPVKWIEDAREHLMACLHARDQVHHVELAVKRDGTLLGIKADVVVDSGAYSCWPWTATAEAGMAGSMIPGPYKLRNYRMRVRAVATNRCPAGPYRGVGRPSACFTIERAMDDVARVLGLDPVEIRLRNYVPDDAYPYTQCNGLVYDSASLVASLRRAADAIGYEAFRAEQAQARVQGRYLGVGFGSYIEQTAHATEEFIKRGVPINFGYENVRVRLDPSGKVHVETSLHSHGQGHETTMAQVVADRMGMPLSEVRVQFGDTRSTPAGFGTFASRSAVLGGGAAWKAADVVRTNLLKVAGSILEVRPEDLEIQEGLISVKGAPSISRTVAEVARTAYHQPQSLPPDVTPADLESTRHYGAAPGTGAWATAVHAAIVEVDARTGRVQILKYIVVEDCGAMINPMIVDGQVQGGTAQGIGGALYEQLIYDESGQLLCTTLMDYLLPSAMEVPRIDVHHVVTPSPFTLGGIKGTGEGGAIAPGAAVANAVTDALAPFGVLADTLPLSPARVLDLIAAGAGQGGGASS